MYQLLFMPSGPEILLLMFLFILFFGAKKIPELAKGLGRGIREFKDASAGIKREIEAEAEKESPKKEIKD